MAYIAGDTLHHQPMGVGHMTVLQLYGPIGFRVLQWCHPMSVQAKRTSYCTRMITVYGARKWIQARALISSIQALISSAVKRPIHLLAWPNPLNLSSLPQWCVTWVTSSSFFFRIQTDSFTTHLNIK